MVEKLEIDKKTKHKSKIGKKILLFIHHLFAISFWTYIVSVLLFFDLDSYLISKLGVPTIYLQYKLVFILFFLGVLWLFFGSKNFFIGLFFLLFYPILLVLQLIFKMLGFSANSFIAVIGYLFWVIKSAKSGFIFFTFYFTFFTVIQINFNKYLTIFSMVCLAFLLFYHYFQRIFEAFRAKTILSSINRYIESKWYTQRDKLFEFKEETDEESQTGASEYFKRIFDKVFIIFIINTGLKFFLTKLQTFQETRILAVSVMVKLFTTFIITVLSYGFLYKGLTNLDPYSFSIKADASTFYYFYVSFNTIITNSIYDFTPLSSLAKILVTTEQICSISILVFLFFVFTTIVRERYQEDLGALIKNIDRENSYLINQLPTHFNITIEQIINHECFEEEAHKKQIEAILKFRTDILKIKE